MTEEAQGQLFERYWLARKALAAYGLSEKFEEEQSFATASSNSASRLTNLPPINMPDVYVQAAPLGALSRTGNMFIVASGTPGTPFEILPRTLATLFTLGQGGSMATQQPPITEDESVEKIIWRVGTTRSIRYRLKLASRLSELQKAVQEEELDGRGITVRSLHHFIELLKAYPALRCPAISATPERNIYAAWKSGSDRVFSIHFLPHGKVHFVIFFPNDKHPGQTIRLSGLATVDAIISVATPHGVLNWAAE